MSNILAQKALSAMTVDTRKEAYKGVTAGVPPFPTLPAKVDESGATMKALVYGPAVMGLAGGVKVIDRPKVAVTDPGDAVIRTTASTVCGSDLHLYHGEFLGLAANDVLGHEAIGIVESVGPDCKRFKPGDRVVVSAVIACGSCEFCAAQKFSLCDRTNASTEMLKLYGSRLAGLFGYTRLLGGYEGCQAEFVRVPIADVNLLKIPETMDDRNAICLADIACTAWHANELAAVGSGDTVAVWGAGPVGLLCSYWAKQRGASNVVVIDSIPARLQMAMERAGADAVIDRSKQTDVLAALHAIFPGGPVCCIDASAFRYASSAVHATMRFLGAETDTSEIVNELIRCCQKGGRIALIADYYNMANGFSLGPLMEKGINLRGGQLWCQKYWADIADKITRGEVDFKWVFTHTLPLAEADKAYRMFDKKEDNVVKVLLKP